MDRPLARVQIKLAVQIAAIDPFLKKITRSSFRESRFNQRTWSKGMTLDLSIETRNLSSSPRSRPLEKRSLANITSERDPPSSRLNSRIALYRQIYADVSCFTPSDIASASASRLLRATLTYTVQFSVSRARNGSKHPRVQYSPPPSFHRASLAFLSFSLFLSFTFAKALPSTAARDPPLFAIDERATRDDRGNRRFLRE